jgi:hypothetical protein
VKPHVWLHDRHLRAPDLRLDLLIGGTSFFRNAAGRGEKPDGLGLKAAPSVIDVTNILGPDLRDPCNLVAAADEKTVSHQLLDGGLSGRAGYVVLCGDAYLSQGLVAFDAAFEQLGPKVLDHRVDDRDWLYKSWHGPVTIQDRSEFDAFGNVTEWT